MRISGSKVSMQAESSQYVRHQVEETQELSFRAAPAAAERPSASSELVRISDEARAASAKGTAVASTSDKQLSRQSMRLQMLIAIVEQITGHKIKLFDASELTREPPTSGAAAAESHDTETAPPSTPEWSLHVERREVHEEGEQVRFAASGKVQVADGREIAFSLELDMRRYERHATTVSIDAGSPRRQDPLVLNLQGGIAQLGSERLTFDLDSDGRTESIAKLVSGSVFLAFDRNENGKIDDGTELFGPQSGDGFGELAQLDDDGNGWIDEADSAFKKLGVWNGGALQSLSAAGVGAIALQNATTPFSLKDGGDDRGQIRATGIFLGEDGVPRTIQHVDLTV